jgi:hypothetical protein
VENLPAFTAWLLDTKRPSWLAAGDVESGHPRTNRIPALWEQRQLMYGDGFALTARLFRITITESGLVNGWFLYLDTSSTIVARAAFEDEDTWDPVIGDEITIDAYMAFRTKATPVAVRSNQ